MEVTLLHFISEAKGDEYIILAEPQYAEEAKTDAASDGYKLENECPLEDASITLPINSVLGKV